MEQPEGLSRVPEEIAVKAEAAVLLIEVPCWKGLEDFGSLREGKEGSGYPATHRWLLEEVPGASGRTEILPSDPGLDMEKHQD